MKVYFDIEDEVYNYKLHTLRNKVHISHILYLVIFLENCMWCAFG